MSSLSTPLSALGVQAEPAKVNLDLQLAAAESCRAGAPVSFAYLPELRAAAMANGADPLRLSIKDAVYDLGLIPPARDSAAPTATPSGAQATAELDLDVAGNGASIYHPADGDRIGLRSNETAFVTTLGSPHTTRPQVLRGSAGADALDNLQDLVNGVNEGITWEAPNSGSAVEVIQGTLEVGDHPTSYQLTLRVKEYGASGNANFAYLAAGAWTWIQSPDFLCSVRRRCHEWTQRPDVDVAITRQANLAIGGPVASRRAGRR